jgi:hypothetical protein
VSTYSRKPCSPSTASVDSGRNPPGAAERGVQRGAGDQGRVRSERWPPGIKTSIEI